MKNQLFYAILLANILLFSCKKNNSPGNDLLKLTKDRKEASPFTIVEQEKIKEYLDFNPNDSTSPDDFKNANKDRLGSIPGGIIYDDSDPKNVIYDMTLYDFLKDSCPPEANPSLWRQSKLNRINGLFEVVEGQIYQIRGFDLANMTLIKGKTGWIVIDPLGSPETAEAGLYLVNGRLGITAENQGVSAVIFTHSHIDHFGGVEGVMKSAINKDIPIYAPKGFFEEAISENVMGGNAMGRRASYMYGNILKKDEKGTLGTGLGQTTSTGMPGIIEGTVIIDETNGFDQDPVDGVSIDFIYTPDAEAPAEMMFYLPVLNAFCQAEEINHTMHNLYTLRGAKVRNGQKWSQYIDQVIQNWGANVEVSFGSHHWPTWNIDDDGDGIIDEKENKIKKFWENQRDMYRFIHDQTLRLANLGETPIEIAEQLKLPKAIDTVFANRGYYGSVSHNARAQYQLYFGWFDGNPANLNKLPPTEVGEKYVDFMGGADNLLSQAKGTFDDGEYRWTAEVLNHLVFAEPDNQNARYLLADTYEQLGYQAESGPWRNFYLSGAQELRSHKAPGEGTDSVQTGSPAMVQGMSNELLFNYLAMCFEGTDSDASDMQFNFQITFLDQHLKNKNVALIVQNGVVTPRIDYDFTAYGVTPTETIEMTREDLNFVISGDVEFKDIVIIKDKNGDNINDINQSSFKKFIDKLQKFDNAAFWFNIIEP